MFGLSMNARSTVHEQSHRIGRVQVQRRMGHELDTMCPLGQRPE
jgi:hypothetical protein